MFYVRAWGATRLLPQSYQYPNLSEGADRVGGQLRGDKECPFSGVTKSGRVWRKVPESDARSVVPHMSSNILRFVAVNCPASDARSCDSWPESFCEIYSNVPTDCPYMCGLCPAGELIPVGSQYGVQQFHAEIADGLMFWGVIMLSLCSLLLLFVFVGGGEELRRYTPLHTHTNTHIKQQQQQ